MLPKDVWRDIVLPRMGSMMGMETLDPVVSDYLRPAEPLLSAEDFQAVCAYIIDHAPSKLPSDHLDFDPIPAPFVVKAPNHRFSPPATTMVQIDSTMLISADANKRSLVIWDRSLTARKMANVQEGAIHVEKINDFLWITVMGEFSPNDASSGFIMKLPLEKRAKASVVIDGLNRPVDAQYVDLSHDGLFDIVVCEYGKWQGQLTAYEQTESGGFLKHILSARMGPISMEVRDFDDNGYLDLMVLFGQGDEGIDLFFGHENMVFERKEILRFPPSYGSSSFRLLDFDGDGDEDIIYTAGDNADYHPVVKPYHGVYVFECKETGSIYSQAAFLPLPGAYGVEVEDFDLDGDLDIAAISFFPDFAQQPQAGFVYFENRDMSYVARSLPLERLGRWMVMDAGDMDGDNDIDLVLGSLTFEVPGDSTRVNGWSRNGIPFVILENTTKK